MCWGWRSDDHDLGGAMKQERADMAIDAVPGVLVLAVDEAESRAARGALRAFITHAGAPAACVDDAVLVMAALLANGHAACRGVTPVVVEVAVGPGLVVVQVTNDRVPGTPDELVLPPIRMPLPDEPRGRGLPLVALLCARLAVVHGRTTTVRAELVW
jgi:hypothetical protein